MTGYMSLLHPVPTIPVCSSPLLVRSYRVVIYTQCAHPYRLVTPRHATSRLSQAEPAPALGPSGHLRSNSDRQIEHGLGRPLDAYSGASASMTEDIYRIWNCNLEEQHPLLLRLLSTILHANSIRRIEGERDDPRSNQRKIIDKLVGQIVRLWRTPACSRIVFYQRRRLPPPQLPKQRTLRSPPGNEKKRTRSVVCKTLKTKQAVGFQAHAQEGTPPAVTRIRRLHDERTAASASHVSDMFPSKAPSPRPVDCPGQSVVVSTMGPGYVMDGDHDWAKHNLTQCRSIHVSVLYKQKAQVFSLEWNGSAIGARAYGVVWWQLFAPSAASPRKLRVFGIKKAILQRGTRFE
ncbi:hypothetical protein F5888DRAFT_1632636 [Russula emetica]|nr:hypothetical protein F5888DRAFT_1632636 [Russula emetica]